MERQVFFSNLDGGLLCVSSGHFFAFRPLVRPVARRDPFDQCPFLPWLAAKQAVPFDHHRGRRNSSGSGGRRRHRPPAAQQRTFCSASGEPPHSGSPLASALVGLDARRERGVGWMQSSPPSFDNFIHTNMPRRRSDYSAIRDGPVRPACLAVHFAQCHTH
uniref:Uncharacterized protein n=1 Tax=Panagrellus redivivus TaxID=6233 RepID=A0A7E4W8J5_PANRE